jgi:hypothetical protein
MHESIAFPVTLCVSAHAKYIPIAQSRSIATSVFSIMVSSIASISKQVLPSPGVMNDLNPKDRALQRSHRDLFFYVRFCIYARTHNSTKLTVMHPVYINTNVKLLGL